jgi:5-methylcytosine-specific restriction endonuclease McrA
MIALSDRFKARVSSLYQSQRNRAKEKAGPSGRVSKKGYLLPFDQKQFASWFIDQFGGVEGGVIRCRYCNRPLDAYSCVVDHEVPLKRGGSPGLQNLGLPCEACNQIKGQLTPDEFKFFLDKMAEMSLRFASGQAVQDITSRLQKAIKLAAGMRFNMAQKARAANRAPEPVAADERH